MIIQSTAPPQPNQHIKPIPRKPSKYIETPKHLQELLKKGAKVKNLKLTKRYGETEPLSTSSIKKLTRFCKHLYGIQISSHYTEDPNLLLKVQYKIREIKHLELGRIKLIGIATQKAFQRLLVRFRYLKKYKGKPEVKSIGLNDRNLRLGHRYLLDRLNLLKEKEKVLFTFHSKESIQWSAKRKTRKLLLSMKKNLSSLGSVEENGSSLIFTAYMPVNRGTEQGEFERGIFGFIRSFKQRYPLDYVTLPSCLKNEPLNKILSFCEAIGLNVVSQISFDSIFNNIKPFERFLSQQGARVVLDPSSRYSSKTLEIMLDFSQEMFLKYGSVIDFKDFTFDFHAFMEVRQALITHFKQKGRKWERVIFLFNANSLDWFQEDEISSLKEMINELCKEENQGKYSEIQWNVSFKTKFEKELATKTKNYIFSVIQDLVQSQQKLNILKKCSLRINFEGEDDENLLSFLSFFQQIPDSIGVLRLDLFFEKGFDIKEKIEDCRPSAYRRHQRDMVYLTEANQSIKQLVLRAEKIKDYLFELKEKNCFREFFIPHLNEINELKFPAGDQLLKNSQVNNL